MPTDHNTLFNGVRINTGISGQSVVQEVERVRDGIVDQLSRSVMHTCERGVKEALIQLGWTPPGESRTQWLPIASAPKDGTVVLTWRKGWLRARMCMLNSGRWFYPFGCPVSDSENDEPTHWQPLSAPPTTD